MAIVTIPFDYDPLRDAHVIPICIEDTDRNGYLINRGWFEAVVPIADPLRALTRRVLKDVWCVSEVAEKSLHAVWGSHGDDLGRNPSSRIWSYAQWVALDIRDGGRNARRREQALLSSLLRKLRSTSDVQTEVEAEEYRRLLREYFDEHGVSDVNDALDGWLYGSGWIEIAESVDKNPKAVTRRFWRWFNKALKDLNLR
jgi:hypothetical protein